MADSSSTSSAAIFLGSSGIVTAVVSVATLFFAWIRDHDATARYTRELTSVTARVTFWKAWLESHIVAGLSGDELAPAKHLGREELNDLAREMRALVAAKAAREVANKRKPWSIRRLLLLYSPPGSGIAIWLLRAYYYYLVAGLFLLPIGYYIIARYDPASFAGLVRTAPFLKNSMPLPIALCVFGGWSIIVALFWLVIVHVEWKLSEDSATAS